MNVVSRWAVGLVFIFSGFVKGVDPMGTSFKIQEYMTAWTIGGITFEWALPFATFLSVALVTAEFVIGVMLISNTFRRLTAWGLAAMMLFFTATTLIDALTNKVTDCGCFGDAVKLTNWQTFWKNIVLDVPTVWIVLTRNMRRKWRFERDSIVLIIATAAMVVFALRNINHEPCIDFRAWKVGNVMMNTDPELKAENYVIYRDNESGKEIEVALKDCGVYAEDTVRYTWLRSRIIDPHEIHADGFSMLDMEGNDWAVDLIGAPEKKLIATIHHLDKIDEEGLTTLKRAHAWCEEQGVQMMILTAALPEEIQAMLYDNELNDIDFYFADATAIETMTRSNPGYVMLEGAQVSGKWHYHDIEKIMTK